ncbi:family 43 glycosylhydrolase [Microlunatus sp. GCM10028923]|uniref:family 43 glycosylhydrolase n=1 Tax=Microlunatus sp. GCM10028923 TaxID=3273400 RepID=UPI00360BC813
MSRLGKPTLLASALALVLTLAGTLLSVPTEAQAATPSSRFPLADPNTVLAKDGTYVTYGTNVGATVGPRCGAPTGVKLFVPFLNHGSGDSVSMSDCAAGDALPGGPGAWTGDTEVWAPGVVEFNGTYFMYYTATKKDSGQKCIGLATSGGAKSPFTVRGEWACPAGGRWAIDADPFVAGGKLYVVYRDDAITTWPDTGISVVQVGSDGFALWNTRRDLMKSTDLNWESTNMSGETRVIENPSIFVGGEGHYYLTFSGNNWRSARYSTGIADCGTSPLPSSRCRLLQDGANQPYFGYTGAGGLGPYRGLPGNHAGPGGMDVFYTSGNRRCVVWHWYDTAADRRHPIIGELKLNSGGFYVE